LWLIFYLFPAAAISWWYSAESNKNVIHIWGRNTLCAVKLQLAKDVATSLKNKTKQDSTLSH